VSPCTELPRTRPGIQGRPPLIESKNAELDPNGQTVPMLKFAGDRAVGLGASDKELVHSFRKMAVKMMVSYLAAQQRAGVRRIFAASFCEPRGILASSPGLRRRRRSPQTPMTRSSLRAGDSASRPKTVVSPQPPSLTPGGVALSPISVRPGLLAGLALVSRRCPGRCASAAQTYSIPATRRPRTPRTSPIVTRPRSSCALAARPGPAARSGWPDSIPVTRTGRQGSSPGS
jgi:hypothetical protein